MEEDVMENPEIIKWLEKRSKDEGECEGNSLYRDAAAALKAATLTATEDLLYVKRMEAERDAALAVIEQVRAIDKRARPSTVSGNLIADGNALRTLVGGQVSAQKLEREPCDSSSLELSGARERLLAAIHSAIVLDYYEGWHTVGHEGEMPTVLADAILAAGFGDVAAAWDEGYEAGEADEAFNARGLPTDPDAAEHPHDNPHRTPSANGGAS